MKWIHVGIAAAALVVAGCELPERGAPPPPGVGAEREVGGFRSEVSEDLDDLQQRLERLRAEGSERIDAVVSEIERDAGEIRDDLARMRDDLPAERRESREEMRRRLQRLEQRVDALEREESEVGRPL